MSGTLQGIPRRLTQEDVPPPPWRLPACDVANKDTTHNCPQPRSTTSSPAKKRAAPTESTADGAGETFQDQFGRERWDCVMLDPCASAFLMSYGPVSRYVTMLEERGFPKEHLKFLKCDRKFFFGGDACSQCRWTVMLPVAVSGRCGFIQAYILPGETPMLMGMPIMKAIGLILDCKRHRVRLDEEPWQNFIVGLHGEYIVPLLDFDSHDVEESPHFELVVPVQFTDFNMSEQVFLDEHMASAETYVHEGEQKLRRHHLTTFETQLNHIEKEQQAYVTSELHGLHEPKPRVLWEVYCGGARLSKVAQSHGHDGGRVPLRHWMGLYNLREHQNQFLQRLRAEMPDELFLAPECKLWSQMRNITARTEDQQVELQQQRQEHHDIKNTMTPTCSSRRWPTRNKLMVLDMLTLSNLKGYSAGKLEAGEKGNKSSDHKGRYGRSHEPQM